MKNLLLIIFSLCLQTALAQNTKIHGKVINPTSDSCALSALQMVPNSGYFQVKELASVPLGEDGTFLISIELDSSVSGILQVCNESTNVLLAPGDDIYVTLNSKMFDETVSYSGKGADKNNHVARIMLMNEGAIAKMPSMKGISDTAEVRKAVYQAYANYKDVLQDYVANDLPGKQFAKSQLAEMESMVDYQIGDLVKNQRLSERNIGQVLAFSGIDILGKKVKSSSFKGKVTVLDFWASWCGPCKAEMPSLKELEAKYGADVNFLGIAVWDKEEDWKHASTKFGLEHSVFIDKKGLEQFEALELTSIPRYVVLDKDGEVVDPNAPRPSSGDLQEYFQ
jgi:thiol-disulfide isomerase/thioredoxin